MRKAALFSAIGCFAVHAAAGDRFQLIGDFQNEDNAFVRYVVLVADTQEKRVMQCPLVITKQPPSQIEKHTVCAEIKAANDTTDWENPQFTSRSNFPKQSSYNLINFARLDGKSGSLSICTSYNFLGCRAFDAAKPEIAP